MPMSQIDMVILKQGGSTLQICGGLHRELPGNVPGRPAHLYIVVRQGDVIATGTNHRGLSAFQDGDLIELETAGLGRLRINVRDDLKRTWGRETRLEMHNKGIEGTTPQLEGKYAPARR